MAYINGKKICLFGVICEVGDAPINEFGIFNNTLYVIAPSATTEIENDILYVVDSSLVAKIEDGILYVAND